MYIIDMGKDTVTLNEPDIRLEFAVGERAGLRAGALYAGKLYLVGAYNDTLYCYDGTQAEYSVCTVGKYPFRICAFGDALYIACEDTDSVHKFSCAGEHIAAMSIGEYITGMDACENILVISAENSLYIIENFDSVRKYFIPMQTTGIAMQNDVYVCGMDLYSLKGELQAYSRTGEPLWSVATGSVPTSVAVTGQMVYVAGAGDDTVSVHDMLTGKLVTRQMVCQMPCSVKADEKRLLFCSQMSGAVYEMDTETMRVRRIFQGVEPTDIILGT